jgi:hypothetical protein
MTAMRRAIIAAALLFGSLLLAWADNRVYTSIRGEAATRYTPAQKPARKHPLRKQVGRSPHEKQYNARAPKVGVKPQVTASLCALSMFFIPKNCRVLPFSITL